MHLKSKAALLCIVCLFVVGTVTQAEDLQVRFLDGNGEVIIGRDVGVLDQSASVVLQKMASQPSGIYTILNPDAGKVQFVLSDPVTGEVTKAAGMIPADFGANTLIDISTEAPVTGQQAPANDDCATPPAIRSSCVKVSVSAINVG